MGGIALPEAPAPAVPEAAPATVESAVSESPAAEVLPSPAEAAPEAEPALRIATAAEAAPAPAEAADAAMAVAQALAGGASDLLAPQGQGDEEAAATPDAPADAAPISAPAPAAGETPEPPEASGAAPSEPAADVAETAPPAEGAGAAAEAPEEAPPEPSPEQAVAPATRAIGQRAAASAAHQPAAAATGAAMAASNAPAVTQRRAAAGAGAQAADEAETNDVDRQSFRQQLRAAIETAMPPPRDEQEAKRLMDHGGKDAAADVQSHLGSHTQEAAGALPAAVDEANQPDPTAMQGGEEVPLAPEEPGAPPAPVGAGPVVPPPSRPEAVDMSANRAATDELAAQHKIDDEMLARGKDPQFDATLGAKSEAEKHDVEGPARLREAEAGDRATTRANAAGAISAGLTGFHTERATQLNTVAAQQAGTAGLTATRKAEITATLEGIGQRTRTAVTDILDKMIEKAGEMFQTAVDEALVAYNAAFDDVRGGLLTRIGDFFTGGGDARFENALQAGRTAFNSRINRAIDEVADYVESQLALARLKVEEGRTEIDRYIQEDLPEDERRFAEDASTAITADFVALEGEIDERRDAVVGRMVEIYREGIERRNAREEELRLANRSLWERVYDATVGVIEKVIHFKNMLLGILARAAAVVEAIISDPIGFLENLIAGITAGLRQFMGNIVENLKQALMGWLFGALEGAGLRMPAKFDLMGFLDIVLQVLGLTKENVRARAVRILGEETVAAIETAVDFIRLLFTEGPQAVWDKLMEKLGEVKEAILGEIRTWVITKVIEAGIKWVLSLLNPASAFVKACLMIYDIVVFFIERGQQIIEAVNAIINALGTIVAGNIGAMANAVEGALNRILPVVISFLASLLGLGGISEKIRGFIEAVQAPVNKAIDWVINLGVSIARRIGALFGGKKDEGGEEEPEDPEKEMKVTAALRDLDQREARQADEGGVDAAEAQAIADGIRADHPVIKSMTPVLEGEHWSYHYTASPGEKHTGQQTAEAAEPPPGVVVVNDETWQISPPIRVTFNVRQKFIDRGLDDEYETQLADQAAGINALRVAQWQERREAYRQRKIALGTGRDPASGPAQAAMRAEFRTNLVGTILANMNAAGQHAGKTDEQKLAIAEDLASAQMRTLHALHSPDQIAGGHGTDDLTGMGSSSVNVSIGAQWKHVPVEERERVAENDETPRTRIGILDDEVAAIGLDDAGKEKTLMNVLFDPNYM